MLEIEYQVREEDLLHFNVARAAENKHLKNTLKRHTFIIPGILIIIALFLWAYQNDVKTALYIGFIGLAWGVSSPVMVKWDLKRQILKSYSDKEKVSIFGDYKLKIEPHYLLEKSPSGKHKYPWNELLRVEYGDKYVFIYVDLDAALIIPVETVTSGNLEAFAEQVEKLIDRHSS